MVSLLSVLPWAIDVLSCKARAKKHASHKLSNLFVKFSSLLVIILSEIAVSLFFCHGFDTFLALFQFDDLIHR